MWRACVYVFGGDRPHCCVRFVTQVKPDTFLDFALDEVADVIGVDVKPTDFGSSRNVNMLMTNMTFTKGIGTPTYMAP